ncbi:MAG: hybrid sensor histidine kinase/response regulator, partial [Nannocystaceae bacterium]
DRGPSRHYGRMRHSGAEVEIAINPTEVLNTPLLIVSARPLDEPALRRRELHRAKQRVEELKHNLLEERSQERAARYDALSVLAGTLAHDINNSLSVVFGSLDLLRETLHGHEGLEIVDHTLEAFESTRKLANRLGTFSRGATVELRPFHLQPWLEVLLTTLGAPHKTEIRLQVPDEEAWVRADESQLTQVLVNLVTNALQASGSSPEIEVRLYAGDVADQPTDASSSWVLDILDRGAGVAPGLLHKIFDPFVTTKETGTGLGLASCASIVKAHRGSIEAVNREGGGLIMKVQLPRSEPTSKATHRQSHARTRDPTTGRGSENRGFRRKTTLLQGLDILVMDDDPLVVQTIQRILHSAGASSHSTQEGESAIRAHSELLAQGIRPLFLCDLNIKGGLDGVSTVRRMLEQQPDLIAIACSGYSEHQIAESFESLGFRAYLGKPFTASELVATILRTQDPPDTP